MKQDTIVSTLILITAIYIVVSLSLIQTLIAFAGGVIAYKITESLAGVLIVLISIPVIVELNRRQLFSTKKEGFSTDGAVTISNRVKAIQTASAGKNAAHMNRLSDRLPPVLKGVVESPEIEGFQSIDASGDVIEKAEVNAPGFSVPAFVKEKGRMLVVPEMSMPRIASQDTLPKPNPMMEMPDNEGLQTALSPDAASLPIEESQQAANLTAVPIGPGNNA
jgi:hypothetical protein